MAKATVTKLSTRKISKSNPATAAQLITAEENATQIAEFLQLVRPLSGVCRCDDARFHDGQSLVVGFLQSVRKGEKFDITLNSCVDILHWLANIEPLEQCSYIDGGDAHVGYKQVLQLVRDIVLGYAKDCGEAQS